MPCYSVTYTLRPQVGRETNNSSDDQLLRQDMPASLTRVDDASKQLEDASHMLKRDPYSQPARWVRVMCDLRRNVVQNLR